MKTLSDKVKPMAILGILALVAIVAVTPNAFAQQGSSYNPQTGTTQSTSSSGSGVTYNDSDNPYGPLSGSSWAVGLAIAGVMSGIGAWTAVRKH